MDYNETKYFEAKAYWLTYFELAYPRDNSTEELDAFENALEDWERPQ